MNDAANLHLIKPTEDPKAPTRELRIAIAIPTPVEAFASAKALTAAEPLLLHAQAEAKKLGGTVTHDVVTPKPRTPVE